MRIITIEENIPGGPLNAAAAKYADADAPYSAYAPGPGLPYAPDREIFADVGEKRIADMERLFLENAPISDADKEKMAHLNAEKLFKI